MARCCANCVHFVQDQPVNMGDRVVVLPFFCELRKAEIGLDNGGPEGIVCEKHEYKQPVVRIEKEHEEIFFNRSKRRWH